MKSRLTSLAAVLVVFFALGASVLLPQKAGAATGSAGTGVSQAARTFCATLKTNSTTCDIGYDAVALGKSKTDACKPYTGDKKTACQKGFDKATAVKATAAAPASAAVGGAVGTATVNAAGTTANGPADQQTVDANCNGDSNPLSWVVCPVIDGAISLINSLDSAINSQLSVGSPGNSSDPNQIFCDNNTTNPKGCNAYHDAWASFRNIALGMMAIAGLIVVITEAMGLELLDAYTIRKVLPRLLIAALGITLSWQLMQFFVELSNSLGYGIRFLIYEPFVRAGFDVATLSGNSISLTFLAAGLGGLALGILGLLSFVGTAVLAVIIAFVVLLLRQILIILLIILAPIAIVAYILPNTQNVYKLWWDSFAKALMMFPIIAGFIAIGRVFGTVAQTSSGDFGQILGFIAYFAPYFLIPLTFRLAGGAIRGIGGFVNDRGRGGFDRLRNYRGQKMEQNAAKMRNFSRFSDNNALGRGVNTAIGAVANPGASLRGRKGIQAARHAGIAAHGAGALKDSAIFQANQGDDKFLLAVANRELAQTKLASAQQKFASFAPGSSEAIAAQSEVDARQHALDTAANMGATGRSGGVQLAALNQLSRTGFQFEAGKEGYDELSSSVRKIVGGNDKAYSNAMNEAQYHLRSAGRYDLGGINEGAGYQPKAGTDKASLSELANAKAESIKGFTDGLPSGPLSHQHAIAYKELEAMVPYAKGGVRNEIVKSMQALEAQNIKGYMDLPANVQGRTETVPDRQPDGSIGRRPITRGEVAQREARSYDRDVTRGLRDAGEGPIPPEEAQ